MAVRPTMKFNYSPVKIIPNFVLLLTNRMVKTHTRASSVGIDAAATVDLNKNCSRKVSSALSHLHWCAVCTSHTVDDDD